MQTQSYSKVAEMPRILPNFLPPFRRETATGLAATACLPVATGSVLDATACLAVRTP